MQQKMTNKRVAEMTEINEISCEVRRRKWNQLGHVLRKEGVNDCFKALGWTPETKDHLEKDCQKRGKAGWKSWNVAKAARDRGDGVGRTM